MSIPNSFMPVPLHWENIHFIGETAKGEKFVYCNIGNIVSWSEGDHDHRWRHFCKKYFEEINRE